MNDSIRHRGPDGEGIFEDSKVALAMRRLAIIDVSGGQQPVFDETGAIAVVFNGEIYNFGQLREELTSKGHVFKSSSDSECIPHLYEEYGLEFVHHLRGMFAIAIWDRNRARLVLARDRMGKKPLYYRIDRNGVAFASELKALLADPATDRAIDEVAISHYLTFQYVPAPFSAVRSVRKLEPAHILVYEQGEQRCLRYWRPEYHQASWGPARSEASLVEEFRERLLDCVGVRLISERPLGAFLSGGLDSSAVVAAMSRLGGGQVKTFSIGFEQESHNELPFARQVAELYGTDHHEFVVRPDILHILPMLARSFDEPFADSSAIPSHYVASLAREHVVVALNGDGGDEALAGYMRYPRFLQGTPRRLPVALARSLDVGGRALRPLGQRSRVARRLSTGAILLAEREPARRYGRFLSYFRPEEKVQLFSEEFAALVSDADSYGMVEDVWDAHLNTDVINRLLAVDTYTYLPGDLLPKVDITTMGVSLEARSPFLDHTFVEWAASLPGDLKLRGATTKYLMKKALAGWLPPEIIDRRKMGFAVPLAEWLRGPLREILFDNLTDQTARDRGWFNPLEVDRLISQHMGGTDRSAHLYALLMLELWHREVIEQPLGLTV